MYVSTNFRSQLEDFNDASLRDLRRFYLRAFSQSQLRISSGHGESFDRVNLCLLPDFELERRSNRFSASVNFEHSVRTLKQIILSIPPRPLSTLAKQTEKTWLVSAQKSWDSIKTCPHFNEFSRLVTF